MTLDDLVNVYFENNRTKNGTTRAGIRAVVEALRDVLLPLISTYSWDEVDAEKWFNEILASDGEEKAARGPTSNAGGAVEQSGATTDHSSTTPAAAPDVCEWRGGPQLAYMGCKPRNLEWTHDRRKCPSCGKPIRFVEAAKDDE